MPPVPITAMVCSQKGGCCSLNKMRAFLAVIFPLKAVRELFNNPVVLLDTRCIVFYKFHEIGGLTVQHSANFV